MKDNNLLQLYGDMEQSGVLIYFSGTFSQSIIEALGDSLRKKIKITDSSPKATKAFSVFIELAQNIINYSVVDEGVIADRGGDDRIGIGVIVVRILEGDRYGIQCGNRILTEQATRLEGKISQLQDKSKDELKALYKEQRKLGPDEQSLGAGLGFIEMARRSSEPLQYSIDSMDEQYSFFTITAVI